MSPPPLSLSLSLSFSATHLEQSKVTTVTKTTESSYVSKEKAEVCPGRMSQSME
jgi:hypothetical protein